MNETVQIKTPWLASKDPEVPSTLNYSTLSMCGRVEEMVRQYPNYIAYEFMGKNHHLRRDVAEDQRLCQEPEGHRHPGRRQGPPSVCPKRPSDPRVCSTAVNMVGAIANMVNLCPPRARSPSICGTPTPWRPSRWISSTPSLKASARRWICPASSSPPWPMSSRPLLRVGYQLTRAQEPQGPPWPRRGAVEGFP